jgi:outer membrane protein OmpA-like peptidoglycan-associated protein
VRQEQGNLSLSRDRASSVVKYFTDVWHIDPQRISTAAQNLPLKHANRDSTDGAQENRRVEITSNDASILAPVILNDTLRVSNPPVIRFKPVVDAAAGLAHWDVNSTEGNTTLTSFQGGSTLPASLDWQLTEHATPKSLASISYSIAAKDSDQSTTAASNTISVEHLTIQKKREERRGDTVIDRFSLILFDVGSSALTSQNAPLIDLIKSHVSPTSRVVVTGYTDRLGNATANQRLAEHRAKTVADSMGAKSAQITAQAQADLYDSSLPEGRLYTRTVNVLALTPVK